MILVISLFGHFEITAQSMLLFISLFGHFEILLLFPPPPVFSYVRELVVSVFSLRWSEIGCKFSLFRLISTAIILLLSNSAFRRLSRYGQTQT